MKLGIEVVCFVVVCIVPIFRHYLTEIEAEARLAWLDVNLSVFYFKKGKDDGLTFQHCMIYLRQTNCFARNPSSTLYRR